MAHGETMESQDIMMQLPPAVQLAMSIIYGLKFNDEDIIKLLPKDLELQFHRNDKTRRLVFARFDYERLREKANAFCRNHVSEWLPTWQDVVDFFATHGADCLVHESVEELGEIVATPSDGQRDISIIGHIGPVSPVWI